MTILANDQLIEYVDELVNNIGKYMNESLNQFLDSVD